MQRVPGRLLHAAPSVLGDVVAAQHAVVSRAQLRALNVRRERVRSSLEARRWQAIGRNVVVMHNAPLTATQRRWAAVLLFAQPAGLAGITAVDSAGLRGFDDELVHVLVAGSCAIDVPPWVRVHNSRRFGAADLLQAPGPPRTPPARSVVDAAAWSSSANRAGALLCAAVQQGLVTVPALERALAVAGQVRHVALMRSMLGDLAGGGHTLAEIDLGRLARRAGMPPPRRQALRREAGGRVRYVDAEFDLPDGTRFVVEIDGRHHAVHRQWTDDLRRQNELVIAGSPVLRFDSLTVRTEPDRVVDQLRRMWRARGG